MLVLAAVSMLLTCLCEEQQMLGTGTWENETEEANSLFTLEGCSKLDSTLELKCEHRSRELVECVCMRDELFFSTTCFFPCRFVIGGVLVRSSLWVSESAGQ